MGRKRCTPGHIIWKLREAELELAKIQTTAKDSRKFGITSRPTTGGGSQGLTPIPFTVSGD